MSEFVRGRGRRGQRARRSGAFRGATSRPAGRPWVSDEFVPPPADAIPVDLAWPTRPEPDDLSLHLSEEVELIRESEEIYGLSGDGDSTEVNAERRRATTDPSPGYKWLYVDGTWVEVQKQQKEEEPREMERRDWQQLERKSNEEVVKAWKRPKVLFTRRDYVSAVPATAEEPSAL